MFARVIIISVTACTALLSSCTERQKPSADAPNGEQTAPESTKVATTVDTTEAGRYYAKAVGFAKASKYDSAIVYFKAAGELYKNDGNWEKYIKSYGEASGQLGMKGFTEEKFEVLNEILEVGVLDLYQQTLGSFTRKKVITNKQSYIYKQR
jgi:hypothetical protein